MSTSWYRRQVKGSLVAALAIAIALLVAVAGQAPAYAAATVTLWNQASGSGFPVGVQIFDTVTLSGGVNPTGTVTFTLFGPDNATCTGTPIFTTSTAVADNGYYVSSRYATSLAGTYSWIAVYGGDDGNTPSVPNSCGAPNTQVSVAKRSVQFSGIATWASPAATDTATLGTGAGPSGPTGTITHKLYGPNNSTCAGSPVFVTTRTVTGSGSYTSASYFPGSSSGTFQWIVVYSGDANNNASATTCSDTNNDFNVTLATTVVAAPSSVARGGTMTVTWSGISSPTSSDWVGLYRTGTADGGSVTAWKYTNGTAGGSVTLKFPWGAAAGTYEVRLMANNTTVRLATSQPITLTW